MIANIHLTRIVNESDKKYGFGLMDDGTNVYIPGAAIVAFGLDEEDVGFRERAALIPDPSGKTAYIVTTFLEDESTECAALREDIEELQAALRRMAAGRAVFGSGA